MKQNKIELKNKQTIAQQEHSQTARIKPVVKRLVYVLQR